MLLFVSSDARPKYAEDILTVLGLPFGGAFRFRYQSDYVANDLQQQVAAGTVIGVDALIAFVGNVGTRGAFLVPVRLATVISADFVADALVVQFTAASFPDLGSWPHDAEELGHKGRSILAQITAGYGHKYYAASARADGLTIEVAGSEPTDWSLIVNRLATLDTFSESYFLRTTIVSSDTSAAIGLVGGVAHLRSQKSVVLRCWFYKSRYSPPIRQISLKCDTSVIAFASDSFYDVNSRYDEAEFWLQPQRVALTSRTVVTLRLPGDPNVLGDLTTHLQVPVIVQRPITPRILTGLTAAVGAALIAAPSILGEEFDVSVRIVLALLGALIVSVVTALSSPA